MAPEPETRDSGEIPKAAIRMGFTLLGALVLAVAGVGYRIALDLPRLGDRVEHLEESFEDGCTSRDCKILAERIMRLETWRDEHTKFGYDATLDWQRQLNDHNSRIKMLEK